MTGTTIQMRAPVPFPTAFTVQKHGQGFAYTVAADGTILARVEDLAYLAALGFVPALDTYGTWTPTLIGSTTPGTQTYSKQTGYYQKTGKLVTAHFNIITTALDGAIGGNAQIGGLPVASGAEVDFDSVVFGDEKGITLEATYTSLMANIAGGNSVADILEFKTGAASKALPVAQLAAATTLRGTLIYLTA